MVDTISVDERAVIGSVILEGRLEDLSRDDFQNEKLAMIWGAIQLVDKEIGVIDLVTVCTKLNQLGELNNVGGPEYIAELQNEVPTGSHASKYAELVKNRAQRGRIKNVLSQSYEDVSTNEELIGRVTSELHSLANPVENKSIPELIKLYEESKKKKKNGMLTRFEWLDAKTNGVEKGMFWVLAAQSFVGKTTFALQLTRNICNDFGNRAVIYTLEQSDINVIRTLERVQRHKKKSLDQMDGMLFEIVDSLRDWDSIAIDAQKRCANLIVVDYAQMVSINGKGIYEKMENLAFAIRGFCNKTGISVILISQISEETRKNRGSHDGAKGGSALFDASDVFLNLRGDMKSEREQREEDASTGGNPAFGGQNFTRELLIAKNKYGDIGYKQTLFNYSLGYGIYSEF